MRVITGTEAELDAIQALVDRAFGYPKRSTWTGSGRQFSPQASWDGIGATPVGWTSRYEAVWTLSSSDAVMRLEDAVVTFLLGGSSPLNASEKAQIATKTNARSDMTNFGSRTPKLPAMATSVAVGAARVDAIAEEEPK